MNSTKRIFYYDFLRALAIILVILCHVDGYVGYTFTSLKHAIPGLLTTTTLPAVPLFVMLTGALLLNKSYSLSGFFKKRFKRIFYPFIFWIAITNLIGFFYFHWNVEEIVNIIFGIISPTWYIWTLIGIYLFIPVLNSFLKEYELKGFEFFLIFWLVTIFLRTADISLLKSLNIQNFSGYVGFAVLGYYLDNKQFNISDKKMFYIGIATLVLSTIFRMIVFKYELRLYDDTNLLFTTIIQSVGYFLTIKYLDRISIGTNNTYSRIKKNFIGKVILSISVCSYGMYLIHYIILEFFEFYHIKSLKLLPVILIITVFASWLSVYLVSKIPYLKTFSGAN